MPRSIAKELDPYAIRVGEELQLYGIRAKINFRCLLKCLACRNGKDKVTKRELRESVELADFMNFKFNQI